MNNAKLITDAWGEGVDDLTVPLGPLEGHSEEKLELAVHEMAHAVLLDVPLRWGNLSSLFEDVGEAIPVGKVFADLNEVRALAVETLVLRALDVNVSDSTLAYMGARNLQLYSNNKDRAAQIIAAALRTKKVRKAASQVLQFLRVTP